MKKVKYILLFHLILLPAFLKAQDSSVIVIPGREYKAGSAHKFFFGSFWRDLWVAPVKVKILNLNEFAGGLTPKEKGGGLQTTSLRFKGADGKEYKFRSVNKDLSKVLPEEIRTKPLIKFIQDVAAAGHPASPVIAAPFHDALEILHAPPEFYVLPDDEKLGTFREYAGMLGTLEEHPDDGDNGNADFKGFKKIKGTYKLFDDMVEDYDNKVIQTDFLKARLLDILIGDWDRHADQWRWAKFEKKKINYWKPIPRDRDQAFSKYDGIITNSIIKLSGVLSDFGENIGNLKSFIFAGRFVDRMFLNEITKAEWDSVTNFVINKITDSLIHYAVNKMPPAMFEKSGEEIIRNLKSRREQLKEASEEYYRLRFKYVRIWGTEKKDYAEVKRLSDKEVEVALYGIDKDTGEKKKEPYYYRKFNCDTTGEIRIYLLGDDDKAVISGEVESSITVVISSGKGEDDLIDSSKVSGYLWSIVPFIPQAERETYFFISGDSTKVQKGSGTIVRKEKIIEPKDEFEKWEPRVLDEGYKWGISPWLRLSSSQGIFIGGGPVLTKYSYKTEPYNYRLSLKAGYATKPSNFSFNFRGDFYSLVYPNRLELNLLLTRLKIINFFGLGNETSLDKSLEENEYYRVDQRQVIFNPIYEFLLNKSYRIQAGASVQYVNTLVDENTFLDDNPFYETGKKLYYQISLASILDSRNHRYAPDSGMYFYTNLFYYPKTRKDHPAFGGVEGEYINYFRFNFIRLSNLAVKIGGKKLWGDYPFFEAAFLGDDNARGFLDQRFAGDASVYLNTELRLPFYKGVLIFPFDLSLMLLGDIGRVFFKGEQSSLWHPSYGGGFLISIINRDFTFSLYFAGSKNDVQYYAKIGYSF